MSSTSDTLRLGILAIGINVSLMIIKIGVGVVGNSYALVADGIESASDIFSSIVTWAGFRLSEWECGKHLKSGTQSGPATRGLMRRRSSCSR